MTDQPDILSLIMDYESGQLSLEQAIAMFQTLIDSGIVSQLQGHYQRTARGLLEMGLVTPRQE